MTGVKSWSALILALSFVWTTTAAQDSAPADAHAAAMPADPSATLEPFIAQYQVFREGKPLGDATMQVVRQDEHRWRVDLRVHGTRGLAGLAGIRAEQSTVFDVADGHYRPLAQSVVRRSLFTRRQTVGVYDWASRQARWTGDVKDTRRAPVPLQAGDLSGLLINLAVIRDAQPGRSLHYRFVDDGRARDHRYTVSAALEDITAGDLSYSAMRVDRARAGSEETILWVVSGVPTPIRVLQREDGDDTLDLRLVEYQGVQ